MSAPSSGARWPFWQALAITLLFALAAAVRAQVIPDHYDAAFQAATDLYLPGRDWRELKAQCYQESLLRPAAVSPVGARGLCQFMPGTWREVAPRIGAALRSEPPEHPVASVHAAALYMRQLRHVWRAPRPDTERQRLAWASYNAGAGNIIRAQRACRAREPPLCRDWPEIAAALPAVTGRHARETQTYVARIERWLAFLKV